MGKGGESDLDSERDDVTDEYHDKSEAEVVGKVGVDEGRDAEAVTGDGAEEEEGSDTEETEAHVRWGPSYGDDNSRFYSAGHIASSHFYDEVFDYLTDNKYPLRLQGSSYRKRRDFARNAATSWRVVDTDKEHVLCHEVKRRKGYKGTPSLRVEDRAPKVVSSGCVC